MIKVSNMFADFNGNTFQCDISLKYYRNFGRGGISSKLNPVWILLCEKCLAGNALGSCSWRKTKTNFNYSQITRISAEKADNL